MSATYRAELFESACGHGDRGGFFHTLKLSGFRSQGEAEGYDVIPQCASADEVSGLHSKSLHSALWTSFEQERGQRCRGLPVSREQALLAICASLLYDSQGLCRLPASCSSSQEVLRQAVLLSGLSENTARKFIKLFSSSRRLVLEQPGVRGPAVRHVAELAGVEGAVRAFVQERLGGQGCREQR